jgi:hypothetical protein
MKKLAVALLLLACVQFLPAQKTRFGQQPPKARPGVSYPLKVHVSAIRLRNYGCDGCYAQLIVDTIIDQKKLELDGALLYSFSQVHLTPGDYNARLVKSAKDPGEAPLYDEYEIVLPDRTIWRGTVTGISE